jgi:cytochrome P450
MMAEPMNWAPSGRGADVTVEPPVYPMAKSAGECPFGPPRALAAVQQQDHIARVRIWDGSTPWLVTGYNEVREVLSSPGISSDGDRPGYPHFSAGDVARREQSKPLLNLDGQWHDDLRRMIARDFTVKQSEARRPWIQAKVDELLDEMLEGPKPADLVQALALPLPTQLICQILGVPYSLRDHFHDLGVIVMSTASTPTEVTDAQQGILDMFDELVDDKIKTPSDDLTSKLVQDHFLTGEIARDDVLALLNLLVVAGHESTMGMIALGTTALLRHPQAVEVLRATEDPKVVARAVEEVLRWINPVNVGRRRIAAEDIAVGGRIIKAGDGVICAQYAADRDPTVVLNPEELDISRIPNRHMAFAFGPHQCLGQNLARVELQVVYSTIFKRIPTLRLAVPEAELEFRKEALVYGMESLPVTW